MGRCLTASLSVVVLSSLLVFPAWSLPLDDTAAQSSEISGVVVDSTGGAMPNAAVNLRQSDAPERRTRTDAAGRFVFSNVPPGPTSITVFMERFEPVTIAVSRTQPDLRIVLQPVQLTETVTVRGDQAETHITTATRTDTPLRDVPQAVTVVSRDAITDQSMQSMADVVRYVPGVGMAQGEGNRDTPVFRGNSSTADFFVDGVRDDVQYFRDLYNVDRVEAMKGPNAMVFGRGGVGGVINRVGRQADWSPVRELALQGGSWNNRRITGDIGRGLNETVAFRVTGLFEDSESYRNGVSLERQGINPTFAFALSPNTMLRAGYEYFHDDRTADRGIPSFEGRPVATHPSTFFGDPDISNSEATVNALSAVLEHKFGSGLTFRNRTRFANYDKFYQNVFPGAVSGSGTTVSISAYNNATDRSNLFNQTDVIVSRATGSIEHKLLAGIELGRQVTDNFRNTGYFTSISPTTTSITVPISDPVTSLPVTFQQSATDADNHGVATSAALYVQDQVEVTEHIQAVVGLRYERFNVDFRNNRTAADFESHDNLLSPRVGLIYKPIEPVSLYANYSLSYLPRAGEQLSSLSLTNQALEPEEFKNYEVGAKWDVRPALAVTAAVYRLDRSNVVIPDPVDPAVSLLVDGQRTKGVELGLSGNLTSAWSVMGAYAFQDGEITRTLSATAQAGARLAQLPDHTFSLWNKYDFSQMWGAGLGVIHRADIFASTDNTVTLPSFTRVDGAIFFRLNEHLRGQLNVENLFDETYFSSAHSNNNITPGSPRAIRVLVSTRF